ncbi:MAG: hypothetical protein WCJ95_19390 [Mariniphaga sp.]
MEDPGVKTDRNGWKYYDRLPQGYRIGTMEDFHVKGRKKVGMMYLIQRADQQYFEVHFVIADTKAENIKPFFEWDMIFVK